MVSPLFQVFSMERELSTPFSLAQTFAAARAVLFSPNSTTVYKLPSNLIIMPRLMSAVFAIKAVVFFALGGKFTSKSLRGKFRLKSASCGPEGHSWSACDVVVGFDLHVPDGFNGVHLPDLAGGGGVAMREHDLVAVSTR